MNPSIINGGIHQDNRRTLTFFNDFDMNLIKRFYITEHFDISIVKAWQGHQIEQKWFYVIQGSFKVVLVKPNDWKNPSSNLPYQEFLLNANTNEILHIPKGIANGFQALEESSKLMVFSDLILTDSLYDDYRFDKNIWYKWS